MRYFILTAILGSLLFLFTSRRGDEAPHDLTLPPPHSQPLALLSPTTTPKAEKHIQNKALNRVPSAPTDLDKNPYSPEAIEYYEAKIHQFCQNHDFPNFAHTANALHWTSGNRTGPSEAASGNDSWSPQLASRPEVLRSMASTIARHDYYDASRPSVINLAATVDDLETWEDLKGMRQEMKAANEHLAQPSDSDRKSPITAPRAGFNLALLRTPEYQAALLRNRTLSWSQVNASPQEQKLNSNLPDLMIHANGILARFQFPLKPALTKPLDQANRGTCGAFSISSALDLAFYLKYGRPQQTSVQSTFFIGKTLRVSEPEYTQDGMSPTHFFWGPDLNVFQPFT
jgi:hypothetical protein